MTLKEILTNGDHFATGIGARLTTIEEGRACAELTVEERHLNAAGVCQGGVYFTLADITFAAVTNSHGPVTVGIQNSITFLKSAKLGDTLTAETIEVYNHHRMPFCETRITNQDSELLCIVTGSAYRKKELFPFDSLM